MPFKATKPGKIEFCPPPPLWRLPPICASAVWFYISSRPLPRSRRPGLARMPGLGLGILLGFGLVAASPVQRLIDSASDHCVDNGCSTRWDLKMISYLTNICNRFDGLGSCVDTSHELNLLSLSTRFDMSVTSLKGICGATASGKEDCCHCMKRLSNSTQPMTTEEPTRPDWTSEEPTPTRTTETGTSSYGTTLSGGLHQQPFHQANLLDPSPCVQS